MKATHVTEAVPCDHEICHRIKANQTEFLVPGSGGGLGKASTMLAPRRKLAVILAACLLAGARGFSIQAISHRVDVLRPACIGAKHRILLGSRSLPALRGSARRRAIADIRAATPGARMSGSNAEDDDFEVTVRICHLCRCPFLHCLAAMASL